MPHAIRITQHGGPDAMQWVEFDPGHPAAGEVRIAHKAIGLNFIDTYHRSGLYPLALPAGLGQEAAGVVESVGPGVTGFQPGDRVAYAGGPPAAYASHRCLPADLLLKLPDSIGFETAAAMMLKGLTAQYLLRRSYPLRAGDTILFHAASGGVGLLACQWAQALGAVVIGTVGSPDKMALAQAHGCAHVIDYRRENFVERVRALTKGHGVPVVYDGVGHDTFTGSLDCLARFGLLVSFGNASGPPPPFALSELTSRGSLYVTRPTLMHHIAVRSDLEAMAAELFEVVGSGRVRVEVHARYALRDAAQAHRDLEARRTTGASILVP